MKFCKLIGRECLGKDCAQYNATGADSCKLSKFIGQYLHGDMTRWYLINWYKYLEEIRPTSVL